MELVLDSCWTGTSLPMDRFGARGIHPDPSDRTDLQGNSGSYPSLLVFNDFYMPEIHRNPSFWISPNPQIMINHGCKAGPGNSALQSCSATALACCKIRKAQKGGETDRNMLKTNWLGCSEYPAWIEDRTMMEMSQFDLFCSKLSGMIGAGKGLSRFSGKWDTLDGSADAMMIGSSLQKKQVQWHCLLPSCLSKSILESYHVMSISCLIITTKNGNAEDNIIPQ